MFRVPLAAIAGLVLWLASLMAVAPTLAQSLSGGNIQEIRIEGTQRIEPETVRSYMRVNPGEPFDPLKLDQSLKNIFSTGLFADVTMRREGDTLIVSVVENPIINRIAFEGNQRLDDETLQNEIELRPRVVFTRTRVQNDSQRILEIYRRSGRFAVSVEPKVIQLPQNRVDLVFEINEGPLTSIKAINFIGNQVFSDGDLRSQIATAEEAFWRIFSSSDTYDPDRLTFDRELLRRFYLSEGYADFRVLSVVAELTPERDGFIVTFTVEEGAQYAFGTIDITTSLRNLDPEALRESLLTEEGETYDATAIETTVDSLTEIVGNLGYAFVEIRPRATRNRDNLTIDIDYEINEGPKVFVERIDIEGNVRTLDRVVRREMRLVEGDAFNTSKVRRSRQRIQNLGFFSSVEIVNDQGTAEDKTIIKVTVEEQSTGDLSFGAGFSTDVGPIGTVGLRERNFLGRGQDVRVGVSVSGERSQLDLSFTEPYFLDRNLAAGFDVFRIINEQEESSFDETRTGGSLRAGYNLTENIRQVLRYTLEDKEIDNVENDASLLVKNEEGRALESSISQEISYDTRDSRFDPHEGLVLRLRNEYAGVGGDIYYVKNSVGGGYYVTFAEDYTASVRGEVGHILGLGQDTRISDRFFLGGSGLRGFAPAGVGPRDGVTDDALGGKQFYTGTLEFSFPIGLPEDLNVRGRLFTDVGSTWDVDGDLDGVQLQDEASPRVAVGTGVSWNSPFGPLVLDLGFAVNKEEFDETEILSFSFGTQF